MKILTPVLLAGVCLLSPRLAAAPWSLDAYLGGDLLVHNHSDTTSTGVFSTKASAKLLVPGLLFKFFIPSFAISP